MQVGCLLGPAMLRSAILILQHCSRQEAGGETVVCTGYVGCTFQETTKNSDANSRNYAYVSCRSTNS